MNQGHTLDYARSLEISDKINFRNMMIEGVVGPANSADRHYDLYMMLLSIHQLIDSYLSGKKFKKQKAPDLNEMFPWMDALRPGLKQPKIAQKAFRLLGSLRKQKEKDQQRKEEKIKKEKTNAGSS